MLHRGLICWVSLALVCAFLAPATADEQQREVWRGAFLTPGNGEGKWKGAWKEMVAAPDAEKEIAATLREVLEVPGRIEESLGERQVQKVLAFLIIRLLDRAPTRPPLLADEILDRLAGNMELVKEIKASLTEDAEEEQPGWQALRIHAEQRLNESESSDARRRKCIWLLSTEANGRSAESVAILLPHARQWIGRGEESRRSLPQAVYLDAFERLLLRRFDGVADAVGWLQAPPQSTIHKNAFERRSTQKAISRWRGYFDLLREASKLPGKQLKRMVIEAKNFISTITDAAKLLPYLDPQTTPEAEIRAHAIGHAASIGPDAKVKAWVDLVELVLRNEKEAVVISGLLDILRTPSFTKRDPGDYSDKLVEEFLWRLRMEAANDTIEHRKQLAARLNALGTSSNIEQGLDDVRTLVLEDRLAGQLEIYVLLLRKYGEVDGARARVLAHHYVGLPERPAPLELRKTAAEALGKAQIRKVDTVPAAQLLRYLLEGPGEDGVPDGIGVPQGTPREAEPTVRAALLDSLQYYPDRETLDLMLAFARADDAAEAVSAVQTLGKILVRRERAQVDAADALARLFVNTDPPADAVLIQALAELARVPTDATDARAKALDTVLAVLDPAAEVKRSDPLLRRAAQTATALGDGREPLLRALVAQRLAAGADSQPWTDLLGAHLVALAQLKSEAHDATLDAFLQSLRAGPELDLAIGLTADLATQAPRAKTLFWQGRQLGFRAQAKNAKQADIQRDLEAAYAAYGKAIELGVGDPDPRSTALAHELRYATCMARAKDADDNITWWLFALEAAAAGGNSELAKRARDDADGPFKLLNGPQLTEEQTARRDAAKKQLDAAIGT